MLNRPPIHPTESTPEDIIGVYNMTAFNKFYGIATSSTNQGDFPTGRLNKEIGHAAREKIAQTLQELRDHGFYPCGYRNDGSINWRVIVKSDSHMLMESRLKELQRLPEEEVRRRGREGYRQLVKEKVVPSVQGHEVKLQEEMAP